MISSAGLVVDASVAVKWYVPEDGSREAAELLTGRRPLLAPDLLVPEVGNILWKKVRRGALPIADAESMLHLFVSGLPLTLHSASLLIGTALTIAIGFQRTVYDALYLALAESEDCQVVTADQRLVNALRGTPLARRITAL